MGSEVWLPMSPDEAVLALLRVRILEEQPGLHTSAREGER